LHVLPASTAAYACVAGARGVSARAGCAAAVSVAGAPATGAAAAVPGPAGDNDRDFSSFIIGEGATAASLIATIR
jgi:hypothetical protein